MCSLDLTVTHPLLVCRTLLGVRGEGDQVRPKAPKSGEAGTQEPLPGRQHEAETQLSLGAKLPF